MRSQPINTDFIKPETLKKYEDIKPLHVLKEYILDKYPNAIAKMGDNYYVNFKVIAEHSLIVYNLKFNITNRKNAFYVIEKFFRRNFLMKQDLISIPKEVLEDPSVQDTMQRVDKFMKEAKW